MAELLKSSLLKDSHAKGIYHAEPNIVTGTLLVKYHPALHSEAEIVQLVQETLSDIGNGKIEIAEKHKNPGIGKMSPGDFFTRELFVDILGNLIAGLFVAAILSA